MGLRSWRIPSQSSPNISESVNKESYPLLQRNVLTPWRGLKSRRKERDQDIERWIRTSPSLSSLTCLDEPHKNKVDLSHAGTRLSRTLSVPETCSTGSLSGFSSITITARKVSLSEDLSSQVTSHANQPKKLPSSSTLGVSLNDDAAIKAHLPSSNLIESKANMGKVPVDRGRSPSDERLAGNLAFQKYRQGYTGSETDSEVLSRSGREINESSSSPLVLKRLFRSCAHLELPPSKSTRSTFYLDKSLSVPLVVPREERPALCRSTLSLYLRRIPLSISPVKSKLPFWPSNEKNMVDFTHNGKVEQFSHLEDMATVRSRACSSDLTAVRAIVAPLPFRARCHSSSAAASLIGKANDVSGPLHSNRRGGLEGQELALVNKRLDSPVVIRNNSAVVSVKCHGLEKKTQNSSHSQDAKGPSPSNHLLVVNSGGSVRSSRDGRVSHANAKTAAKVQDCLISPHVPYCTCESSSSNQSHSLSLKEALELFRPDFIFRSKRRVLRLEQMARERRSLQNTDLMCVESSNKKRNWTKPHPLSDNLFKPKDRSISGKEMQLRSRRIYKKLPEVTKKKEEEKRRLVLQTNRLRAEVFKKKLLDQILQRSSD